MSAIFISYRRDDAEGHAGRLFDDLVAHFGEGSVFMDVVTIEPGRDVRTIIDENVAGSDVVLTIIGKNWLEAKDEQGHLRIEDPSDFVRIETISALERDVPVIPVLVHNAVMPRADQLPPELEELAFRNGVELTHARWASDVKVLITALENSIGSKNSAVGDDKSESVPSTPESQTPDSNQVAAQQGSGRKWVKAVGLITILAVLSWGGLQAYQKYTTIAHEKAQLVKQAEKERARLEKKQAEQLALDKEKERLANLEAEAEAEAEAEQASLAAKKRKALIASKLTLKIFENTGLVASQPTTSVEVPEGYKIVGGGARVNVDGVVNLLTSSYPATVRKWVADAKDHRYESEASITAYAVAIHDPQDRWDVEIFSKTSAEADHPISSVTVPKAYRMTGGGARVHWAGYGSLLTASFPRDKYTWEARGKDHIESSPATITSYAIGIRPSNNSKLPESKIFSNTGTESSKPANQNAVDSGHLMTGGGAIVNWQGYGNILTGSFPATPSMWKAAATDHHEADPSSITVYAIGLKQ